MQSAYHAWKHSMPYDFFQRALDGLEDALRQIEIKVPPPIRKPWAGSFVFRYRERTIQQAIVQKLARMLSGLHAIEALLERGLFQEQGMVQRVVAEIDEDVQFLSIAVILKDITERPTQFLDYFYAEEFSDPSDVVESHESRGMLKREKIREYIHRKTLSEKDATRAKAVDKVLTKAYSGFVHAASPHIMDMYGGAPPRFDVSGAFKQFRYASQQRDAMNYFYRGVLTMALAAQAFQDDQLYDLMRKLGSRLEIEMRDWQ
jgi:hypothetical protein